MGLDEFKSSFALLRGAYGERVFPKERESVLWNRFKHATEGEFRAVVERIVLRMPQPHQVIDWLDDAIGSDDKPRLLGSVFACPPCRDFGFGWVDQTVVACSCQAGRQISPADLARHQKNYEEGKGRFLSPGLPLPYDKNERVRA